MIHGLEAEHEAESQMRRYTDFGEGNIYHVPRDVLLSYFSQRRWNDQSLLLRGPSSHERLVLEHSLNSKMLGRAGKAWRTSPCTSLLKWDTRWFCFFCGSRGEGSLHSSWHGSKKWTRLVAPRRGRLIVIRESNTNIHNREVFCPCSMAGPAFPAKRSVLSEISGSCLL